MFFPGFERLDVTLPQGAIRLRRGGSGPALLLLHGSPQTHAMWHAVAPALARDFTVYCPDLPGHGGSFKPAATPDHAALSKATMAADMRALMAQFGHARFAVAGHGRGGQVAHRLALDAPGQVERLAVLDIPPPATMTDPDGMASALAGYQSFWFVTPQAVPQQLINLAPKAWFKPLPGQKTQQMVQFHPDALAEYLDAAADPATVAALCEQYLATTTIDQAQDRISLGEGQKIACPLLVLWSSEGQIGGWYDPLALWREHCTGPVSGGAIEAGHHLAEEAPDAVLQWFADFFALAPMAAPG